MKKRFLFVLVSGALVLAGCSGTNSSSKTSATSSAISTSSAPTTSTQTSSSATSSSATSSSSTTNPSVTSVVVNGAKTVEAGSTITLSAAVTVVDGASQSVVWSSANDLVATVDETTGVVTGVAAGVVKIKATSTVDATKYGELEITVTEKAAITLSLELRSGDSNKLTEGGGANLVIATLANVPADAKVTYAWSADTNAVNVASAEAAGFGENTQWVTPVNYGEATVTCEATYDSETYSATLLFTVAANYSTYTTISTAADFLALVQTTGTINGKYALAKNIDLNGAVLNGRDLGSADVGNVFSGTLDGCGYTVKNFKISNSTTKENDEATGMFHIFNGTLRNIHLIGTLDVGGFGGLLAKEVNGGSITNSIFECTFTREADSSYDWTWKRNGVIGAVLQGSALVKNVVTKLTASNAITMPFFAYSFTDSDNYKIEDAYTNIAHDTANENFKTFNPNGGTLSDSHFASLNYVDFDNCTASDFPTLPESVFTFEDNKMPVLAHDKDDFSKLSPTVSFTSTAHSVEVNATITVVAVVKNGIGTIAYSSSDPETATVDSVTGVVTGKKEGTVTITASTTIDEVEYKAELAITVKAAGSAGDVSERFAVTLSSAVGGAWLKGHFTWADGYALTESDVDYKSASIVLNSGATMKCTGAVGPADIEANEIVLGFGFSDTGFFAAANHTFTVTVTLDDVSYLLSETFVGQNNASDATFEVISQNCALA